MIVYVDYQETDTLTAAIRGQRLAALSDARRQRLAALRAPDALARSLTGDRLARQLAGRLLKRDAAQLLILDGPSGQPRLRDGGAHISISHAGAYAAAAAAPVPVGVDIECPRVISEALCRRVCSPGELAWLHRGPQAERALRLWTMKEAYGKMRGAGIFAAAPLFHAAFSGDRLEQNYPDCTFRFPAAPPGYALTVCVAGAADEQDLILFGQ